MAWTVLYEELARTWTAALRASDLSVFGVAADEKLDLRSLERSYEVDVEPVGGQKAEPFTVTAKLGWRWSALDTARSAWREEEVLAALHGREQAHELETSPLRVRLDIVLNAALPWGRARPMPPKQVWRRWVREVNERLSIEPLIPDETSQLNDEGSLEILGWQGQPEVDVELTAEGESKYSRLHLAAFQMLQVPRHFDDPDREDDGPGGQLREMFGRVRRALLAWTECLDLLPDPDAKPRPRRTR